MLRNDTTNYSSYLRYLLFIFLLVLAMPMRADSKGVYFLSGIVRDAETLEPLPFASVTVGGEATGTLTNDKGIFELTVPVKSSEITAKCLGYKKKTIRISKNQINIYDIMLEPETTELQEVVVHRPKYSKKNNPAVDFLNKLKEKGPLTDPERNDWYNYNRHEIITIGLNDFAEKNENSWMFKKFPFLWEHVDTSEVSGKPILNVLIKEKASNVHYRKSPKSRKELINGLRQEGIDKIADQNSIKVFLEDVLREIDLYNNDINILQNRFVSPLSPIAPDFYKFYLTDTVEVNNEKCIVLSFYPHNQAAFGFNGQVFVPVNDSTMFIKKVTMRTPRNINLNFIENMYISQEFERAPDGSRLKVTDDLTIEARIIKGTPGFYARRNVAYNGHNFDVPDNIEVFNRLEDEIIADNANIRDEVFWDQNRIVKVTENETKVDNLLDRLRQVPVFYWSEKTLKVLFTGYINTAKNSKFDIGPMNTTVSFNDVEGTRLRFGGITTANLNKRLFSRFYGAWGTKDHKWKYGAEIEYSFIDKEYHTREFPVHSLRFSSLYDIDQIGQHYLFTNQDNIFLSLKRLNEIRATYHRVNKLDYTLELRNNFSVKATLQNERQEATPWIPFVDGYGNVFSHYNENSLSLELRYAPGEKFYQTKTHRIPINLDTPVFLLSHTIAPKNWFGSKFPINKTEISMQKRVWFSAFGFTDIIIKGGHVWSRSPFINLLIPNANMSYTIQPESFALLNPMEFINDSYASWDITYWLNGALLNYAPLVKKLKLREVVSFRGIYGHLSDRNNPELNPELFRFPYADTMTKMNGSPYMEVGAGLDNIFKCLRLDYVWRLNYLNVPYKIDRRGLRVQVHVTF